MASTQSINLLQSYDASALAGAGDTNASLASKYGKALIGDINPIGYLKISDYTGTGNVTVKIQHCHDPEDGQWEDLVSFTAASANGVEHKDIDSGALDFVLGTLRALVNVDGTVSTVTIDCKLLHDRASV